MDLEGENQKALYVFRDSKEKRDDDRLFGITRITGTHYILPRVSFVMILVAGHGCVLLVTSLFVFFGRSELNTRMNQS